jgi:hypothetical protein
MPALIDQEYCTIDTATTTLDVYYGTPRLCLCDRILSLFYLSVFVLVEWAAKSAPRAVVLTLRVITDTRRTRNDLELKN